jgi:hypothetical protein
MALTNPISSTNIASNFRSTCAAIANDSYGSGDNPTRAFFSAAGSTFYNLINTADKPTVIGGTKGDPVTEMQSEANIAADLGTKVSATTIYNTLNAEAAKGTNHKYAKFRLLLQGSGGNSGTWGTPVSATYLTDANIIGYSVPGGGYIMYDENHRVAMSTSQRSAITNPTASTYNLVTGGSIEDTKLQNYFTALKDAILAVTGTGTQNTYYNWACHTSCHNSCHGSRGRR